ncbi:hypothetical protein ACLB2K_009156 [Fragaria x ananassa]
MRGNMSISDFLDKINSIADNLALAGSPTSDNDLVSIIMNNVLTLSSTIVLPFTLSNRRDHRTQEVATNSAPKIDSDRSPAPEYRRTVADENHRPAPLSLRLDRS